MRICDKCKKKLRKGDGNSHLDFGDPFVYDLCQKCEEKFLMYVDDFFTDKETDNGND